MEAWIGGDHGFLDEWISVGGEVSVKRVKHEARAKNDAELISGCSRDVPAWVLAWGAQCVAFSMWRFSHRKG